MEPIKVPKKVNRHILKALDYLQMSRTDFVPIEDIQNRVRWSLRYTKPVENLEYVVLEALNTQIELGLIIRNGSKYAMALGLPGLHSKKVNRHVLKALDFLQTSRTDFVPIDAIQDRVKRSLRYTKPVSNLEVLVKECLRNQSDLGIVSRSGSTNYAMTLAFQRLRSVKNGHRIKKNEAQQRCIESLSPEEIAMVRKMLRKVQKSFGKKKQKDVKSPKRIAQRKAVPNMTVKTEKSSGNGPSIICDRCYVLRRSLHGHMA